MNPVWSPTAGASCSRRSATPPAYLHEDGRRDRREQTARWRAGRRAGRALVAGTAGICRRRSRGAACGSSRSARGQKPCPVRRRSARQPVAVGVFARRPMARLHVGRVGQPRGVRRAVSRDRRALAGLDPRRRRAALARRRPGAVLPRRRRHADGDRRLGAPLADTRSRRRSSACRSPTSPATPTTMSRPTARRSSSTCSSPMPVVPPIDVVVNWLSRRAK